VRTVARLLPEIGEAPPGSAMADPGQLFEAIAQFLKHVALARSVLLILEDVHWADQMYCPGARDGATPGALFT
jgi:hypothetical protein